MKYTHFIIILIILSSMIKIASMRTTSYYLRKDYISKTAEVYQKNIQWKDNFIYEVLHNNATERFYNDGEYSSLFKVKNKTQIVQSSIIELTGNSSPYDIFIDTKHIMTDTSPYMADNTNFTYNARLRDKVILSNSSIFCTEQNIKLFSSNNNIYRLEEIPSGHVFNDGELNHIMVKNMDTEEYVMFDYVYCPIPEDYTTIEIRDLMNITKIKTMYGHYYVYDVLKPCTLVNKLFSTYELNGKEMDGISIDLKENDILTSTVDMESIIVDYLKDVDITIENTLFAKSEVIKTAKETVVITGY